MISPGSANASFFESGLRFGCTQCGKCCRGEPGTVYVSEMEAEAMASHLTLSLDAFVAEYAYRFRDAYSLKEHPNGDCIFYTDTGCSIYPVRPAQCRTFPFWIKNLRSEASWDQATSACPGIGSGRLYTLEAIIQQVADSPL